MLFILHHIFNFLHCLVLHIITILFLHEIRDSLLNHKLGYPSCTMKPQPRLEPLERRIPLLMKDHGIWIRASVPKVRILVCYPLPRVILHHRITIVSSSHHHRITIASPSQYHRITTTTSSSIIAIQQRKEGRIPSPGSRTRITPSEQVQKTTKKVRRMHDHDRPRPLLPGILRYTVRTHEDRLSAAGLSDHQQTTTAWIETVKEMSACVREKQ